MSLKIYVFDTEDEARKCAAKLGNNAKIVYRGEYRHDWLVSVDE